MSTSAIQPDLVPMEALRVFTPLGIRFWDPVLDVQIDSGLVVTAVQPVGDATPVTAFLTKSGIYAFQGLPGMRTVEFPPTEGSLTLSPPAPVTFVIVVEDTLRRFLPAVFSVDLPLPFRGVFPPPTAGSPPSPGGRAYLFSAPARPVPPGMAAVRADVREQSTGNPAPFTVLHAQMNGNSGIGIADARGSALVLFPFPVIERLRLGSPPGSGQGPVTDYTRPVTLTAQYAPAALSFPLAARLDLPQAWRTTPSLKSILNIQTAAGLWETDAGPAAASLVTDLRFGQELILATRTAAPQGSSNLLISAGTSPP